MEQIMNLLCEVEEKANKILSLAEEEKKQLRLQMDQKIKEFDEETEKGTRSKVEELQMKYEQELKKGESTLLEEYEMTKKEIEENYRKNHDRLVDELFHNIIGE